MRRGHTIIVLTNKTLLNNLRIASRPNARWHSRLSWEEHAIKFTTLDMDVEE